jgi:hypothetical protein
MDASIMDFAGKVALVTGGGVDLGRSCAMMLGRRGASVIVADGDLAAAQDTKAGIIADGGSAIALQVDVSDAGQVRKMIDRALSAFGGFHIAINAANYAMGKAALADIDDEAWNAAKAVNVNGVFFCLKHEIRAMLAQGDGGAIVNVGYGTEHSSGAGLAWYVGAKQAVYGMTRCASRDYADQGLRINAVGPGMKWLPGFAGSTGMNAEAPEELDRIAAAAIWLCSSDASYVHGHTLVADGGMQP